MSGVLDYMQLCRLCLVKDKVNVPIFGDASDVRQIFLKITACLPVKVSQDDNLPKSICDTCLYKVDLLYQFWNTSVNAEKQLIQWLGEIGVDVNMKSADPPPIQMSHAHPHSITPESIMLKEERHDSDVKTIEGVPQGYIPPPQLVYGAYNAPFAQANASTAGIGNNMASAVSLGETTSFPETSPTLSQSKRTRGRPASKQLPPTPPVATTSTAVTAPAGESMDEDSSDRVGTQDDSDDSMEETGGRIAKEEAESEEEYDDNTESLEPTTFVGVPSTTSCDTDQPGPSGLNKPPTTTDTGFQQGMKNNHNFYGQSGTSLKLPFAVWENNSQKISESFDTMTIKVEPLDLDWEDDLTLLDLKNKMGLSASKHKKRIRKVVIKGVRKPQKNVCVLCEKIIRGRSALINHYLLHKENRVKINMELISKCDDNDFLRCNICMKEFTMKLALEKHAEYHLERPFFCEKCNKSFKQSQNFLTHMSSHQASTIAMTCRDCDFSTTFKLAFDKHVKSHTREEYKCELCSKVFPARTWFIEHKNFHTGEKPFSCEECGKCFPYSRYLTAHKKSMHPHCYFKEPELNECQICKKRYSHKNSLRLHMKSHTGENSYLCDVCGKSLSSTDKLQLHKRIHSGYKPYSCTVCEKSFTKKDILTDHMRVHSGEKPFACETCGKCFSQRSPLTIHKRYHTGERPYVCHLCNKGFVSKGILGIHLKQGKHA